MTLAFLIPDLQYFLYVGPAILLGLYAQWKVHAAFARGREIQAGVGLTGAQTARRVLDAHGLHGVPVEPVQGFLSDHYDPRDKVIRLSPEVYEGRSVASLGIAAHEAGHALQDAQRYPMLALRNLAVPLAALGGNASVILLMIGMALASMPLAVAGLVLFGFVVVFQIVNLPVEFDASARARRVLLEMGLVRGEEDREVGRVLNAAALTYVAGTVTAVAQLLYFAMTVLGSSQQREE